MEGKRNYVIINILIINILIFYFESYLKKNLNKMPAQNATPNLIFGPHL